MLVLHLLLEIGEMPLGLQFLNSGPLPLVQNLGHLRRCELVNPSDGSLDLPLGIALKRLVPELLTLPFLLHVVALNHLR